MKAKNYLVMILLIIMLLMVNSRVNAATTCDNTTMQNLKKLAKEVNISYELIKKIDYSDGYRYNIIIDNLVKELYVEYSYYKVNYSDTNNGSYTLKHVITPRITKAKINIYVADGVCKGELLRVVNINFPYYNPFSDYEECQEYKDADICRKDIYTYDLTDDDFKKEIEEYKKELENKKVEVVKKKSTFVMVKDFVMKYKIPIGIGAVVIVVLIIIIGVRINIKRKKRVKINLGDRL